MSGNAKPTSVFFLLLVISSCLAGSDRKLSAYEVVELYNLPAGILPKGVLDYDLNRETGEFKVRFNGTCEFSIESYELKYQSTISGVISTGRVRNLKGVSVKVLFFWVNIVEVSRENDDLDFSVGIASASFAADNFVESPQCGCGFDCNEAGGAGFAFST
ncbi:PREDICTED: uncharacterized protein LOC104801279 [Tarenaya hassleriana]|uniref:uncharacterized protein LOC104801279 n=1 Tax=Tarenaya hassleriana TaxID=28532 RepID=UPI00053C618D|nr:PREDICTED: uncharacterized protein LOC104801279 [Tarenaya hassleriana]